MGKASVTRLMAALCLLLCFASVGGVFATWNYARGPASGHYAINVGVNPFDYKPPMPDKEKSLLERLDDILNQRYSTDIVIDSRDYLLTETIKVAWDDGDMYFSPYVGSMDTDEDLVFHMDALFGDILEASTVSFILKSQDLNWDGYKEIALYSTSDPLDSTDVNPGNPVCVYVSVFTPVLDAQKNIMGYTLVCESLRGFAPEVRYSADDPTPSFSTDHWADNVGYWYWTEEMGSYIEPVPADALANDGSGVPFREHFASYNSYYQSTWWATFPCGNNLISLIWDKIPWLQ